MKWEYKIESFEVKGWVSRKVDPKIKQRMSELGENGWELTGVLPLGGKHGGWGAETGSFTLIFKRQK